MAGCEVSVVSGISKYEEKGLLFLSSNQDEKQTEEVSDNSVTNSQDEKQTDGDEEVNGEGDGNSFINTRNESDEEQNTDVDWMNEYPPLVSRGIQVFSANSVVEKGRSTLSWVDALKKPRCPFNAKVIGEKFDISTEGSVASSDGCSRINLLDVKVNGEKSDISSDSQEESVIDDANELSTHAFSIKIPRFDDEVLKEQIRLLELQVAEKTALRDSIPLQLERRVQENGYENAVGEVKSAQELVKLNHKEMDSHLSKIRTVRNGLPFDDLDCQEANEQQMLAEEHLKALKKELDTLKASALKIESAAAVAQKQSNDDHREVKQLQPRFRAASDACQTANAQMRSLRAQQQENMKQFHSYLDEANSKNQLNKLRKVCNKDNKFRQDCVKSDAKSTIQRFGTLDGRALGPDEKPVMLPQHVAPVVEKENREKSRKAKDVGRQEVEAEADLKEDVSIENIEETERKEQKVEAEKGEKKRQKRLRLRERKKAAAFARDGSSLDPTPLLLTANQNVDKEASTPRDFVSEIASLELEQENEDQENEDEMLEKIETQEASSSLNVQQQTVLFELVEVKEAQKREKRRNKKKGRKKAKAKAKAKAAARHKKMKWFCIIFISLTLMLCLTNMDLQLVRQILH